MRTLLVAVFFALAMTACIRNLTPAQRAQDAANDFTLATRFGRMDVALERVSPADRERFLRRHASWGSSVRIVDCDIVGLRLTEKDRAEVAIAVSWQRIDESEMRVTHVAQHWRDRRGTWLLESEERAAGDVGLLGEPTTVVRPSTRPVRFESTTLH